MQIPPPRKLFVLEGNIGAGKTTFLKILNKHLPNITVIQEPTKKWQHIAGDDNILSLFYKDTKRWAYTFQSYAFISRVQAILDQQTLHAPDDIYVLERSVYCDRFCFAKNCFDSGLMTQLEWQIYKEWFSWLAESYIPRPAGFIYLKTTPQISFERSGKRSRTEEAHIPFAYFEALHKKHEDWLIHKLDIPDYLREISVLTLDCDKEFEINKDRQYQLIDQVQGFINTAIVNLPIPQQTAQL